MNVRKTNVVVSGIFAYVILVVILAPISWLLDCSWLLDWAIILPVGWGLGGLTNPYIKSLETLAKEDLHTYFEEERFFNDAFSYRPLIGCIAGRWIHAEFGEAIAKDTGVEFFGVEEAWLLYMLIGGFLGVIWGAWSITKKRIRKVELLMEQLEYYEEMKKKRDEE